MEIPKDLMDEIFEYCKYNKITDVDGFILRMLKQGFTTEKYGATPIVSFDNKSNEYDGKYNDLKNEYENLLKEYNKLLEEYNNKVERDNDDVVLDGDNKSDSNDDIYGEDSNKIGFFGSNLSDLWKLKKKKK